MALDLPQHDADMCRVATWSELEERLCPAAQGPETDDDDMEINNNVNGNGRRKLEQSSASEDFEPQLCHLRRVLFWLESQDLGDPVSA